MAVTLSLGPSVAMSVSRSALASGLRRFFFTASRATPDLARSHARVHAAATSGTTSVGRMTAPDPDLLVAVLEDIATPRVAVQLLVGTPSRDVFSPQVLLLLLKRAPKRIRLESARAVVTGLIRKAEKTQIEDTRSRCFESASAVSIYFAVSPVILPTRTITPYQYGHLAPLWGMSTPCGCRVVRRSSLPAALEFVRFREWHTHTYCDVPGDRPDIQWSDISSVLVRQFAHNMVLVAVRSAGRELFPSELQSRIAQFVVSA